MQKEERRGYSGREEQIDGGRRIICVCQVK